MASQRWRRGKTALLRELCVLYGLPGWLYAACGLHFARLDGFSGVSGNGVRTSGPSHNEQ